MKYLPLLLLVVVISCGEEEADPKIECRLTEVVNTGAGYEVHTVYTYDTDGRIITQVRTNGNTTLFNHAFTYNSDGQVERQDLLQQNASQNQYILFEYAPDGKLASTTTFSATNAEQNSSVYTWTGTNVKVETTNTQLPNPFQVLEHEYSNENVIKTIYKSYTGQQPNVLAYFSETTYENYDDALSAFYVASLARPGYSVETSKNNPGKLIQVSETYDQDGQVVQEASLTVTYTHTYNESNATLSSQATSNGAVSATFNTYEKCN